VVNFKESKVMKVTPEILISMGFYETFNGSGGKVYSLRLHHALFTIEKFQDYWKFCNHSNGHWHSVTDVEEMIPFAFHDGYDAGVDETKKQMREFLGCK
jgi:hypothetical protein